MASHGLLSSHQIFRFALVSLDVSLLPFFHSSAYVVLHANSVLSKHFSISTCDLANRNATVFLVESLSVCKLIRKRWVAMELTSVPRRAGWRKPSESNARRVSEFRGGQSSVALDIAFDVSQQVDGSEPLGFPGLPERCTRGGSPRPARLAVSSFSGGAC